MSFWGWVPGLSGNKQVARGDHLLDDVPPEGTNARVVYDAAQADQQDFVPLTYQESEFPYPILSSAGRIVAGKLAELQAVYKRSGNIAAGSTGVAVFLQALTNHGPFKPRKVVLFQGVYNVFDAIYGIAAATKSEGQLRKVLAKEQDAYDLPVVGNDAGTYPITKTLLNDPRALHLFDPKSDGRYLKDAFQRSKIHQLHIIASENDPVSPPALAHKFGEFARAHLAYNIQVHITPGGHDSPEAREKLRLVLAA